MVMILLDTSLVFLADSTPTVQKPAALTGLQLISLFCSRELFPKLVSFSEQTQDGASLTVHFGSLTAT